MKMLWLLCSSCANPIGHRVLRPILNDFRLIQSGARSSALARARFCGLCSSFVCLNHSLLHSDIMFQRSKGYVSSYGEWLTLYGSTT
ncbi:hypothetical protein L917_13122 [Phytophthora nicotianae]|uniref:Uncharacterized protein n=2 Tax=Phytophthora nicotianae TaxID=4792 RepID=W2R5V8_PHYN3|nr:hypothetical protein PPTG_21369 [Phytophthora nicotianae INRA-310]ETL87721.1 hypothetical protein L917_13122 [Phytophthora nicotianae]ETM40948.1 hypothetical protein L914_13209 [Phytophthora nicotianae]ETN20763.1 hypothetical protein PPTG_21369 [Phytophthora nicotianae INRA-310]